MAWNSVNSFHSGVQLKESYSGNMEGQNGSRQVHTSNTGNGGMVGRHRWPEITGFCDLVIKKESWQGSGRSVASMGCLTNSEDRGANIRTSICV